MPAAAAPNRHPHDIVERPRTHRRSTGAPSRVYPRPQDAPLAPSVEIQDAPPQAFPAEVAPKPSAKTRARRRRAHRAMRPSWGMSLLCALLLTQFVALLWLQGVALSARNRASELKTRIDKINLQIARTEDKKAVLEASLPQIQQWAQQDGWKPATQADFDDVTNLKPRPKPAPQEQNMTGSQ